MSRPLFASGTARGGTNLITMMLSVHHSVSLAQDPYLPLFKIFRNQVVRDSGCFAAQYDYESALDEYYYFENRLSIMRLVQEATLDHVFDNSLREKFHSSLVSRMKLSSPLLAPYANRVEGSTFKELFDNALEVVALGRETPNVEWLGFNDNWTVEFFPALARSYQNAKFVVIIRDVRASIASTLKVADPARRALTMSFVRCWRKQLALTIRYKQMDLFRDRLHVVSYEQIVREPESEIRRLCEFLEISYTEEMIDSRFFVGPSGSSWIPNSNFKDVPPTGVYSVAIDRWKTALQENVIDLIELVAGPDLRVAGYDLTSQIDDYRLTEAVYDLHSDEQEKCKGWRTDNRNPDLDFSLELLRHHCLNSDITHNDLIQRCFLFEEAYETIKSKSPTSIF